MFVEVPPGSVAFHHGLTFHLAKPNTTGTVRRVHTAIYFADGSTRGEGRFPHPSVERAGIAMGAVIASDVTPIALATPRRRPARSAGPADRRRRVLTDEQLASWTDRGFFRIAGFASPETVRGHAGPGDPGRARARPGRRARRQGGAREQQGRLVVDNPEDGVSKIFRLHRDTVFADFAHSEAVIDPVAELIAPDIDVFLSQFIFKTAGAWGQPWHQDSFYFPFEPARPVVGVWLAVTEATLVNGCLHVLPGSQTEPVHTHVPDRRPGANYGYFEIVDHDMTASEPVLMDPGDLLVFDSHLMHCSTDNESDGIRAAMVYHYAAAGTVDHTEEYFPTVNDWVPARRGGLPTAPHAA